ncbi:MAG: YqaJ viral recombinase family protein [Enterococcus sp.]|nr:YqaJ viral recombinase family protein [Enterococcus sp.]
MNYEILNIDQRSEEWHKIRRDCITGTTAELLLKYGMEIALEKIRNKKHYKWVSNSAQRGTDLEPIARILTNARMEIDHKYKGIKFEEVGFVKRTDVEHVGCSPDGIYLEDEKIKYNLEIKCFEEAHHLACSGMPDEKIMTQIQWCLYVTGAEACFFVQYNPDMIDPERTSDGESHPDKIFFMRKITPSADYFEAFNKRIFTEVSE